MIKYVEERDFKVISLEGMFSDLDYDLENLITSCFNPDIFEQADVLLQSAGTQCYVYDYTILKKISKRVRVSKFRRSLGGKIKDAFSSF